MNKNTRFRPVRFALHDDVKAGTSLELPRQNTVGVGLVVVVMFIIFAAVLVQQISDFNLDASGSVFNLMTMLFMLFWIIGWSTGVVLLGLLVIFIFLIDDSARLADGQLVYVLKAGPFRMISEYDLSRMRNLRVETEGNGDSARVLFDYDEAGGGLGGKMPLRMAERNVEILNGAMASMTMEPETEFTVPPAPMPPKFIPPEFVPPADISQRRLPLASMLVLVAANLVPLFFVLSGEWTLGEVMVLYWAESAVIGLYTLLKIAVVAKWLAPFPGLFFMAHFGGFMAIHFLFIDGLFVRGINAGSSAPDAFEAIAHLFTPLWPALLALVVSHGVSFVLNFLVQREYEGSTVRRLMNVPYRRIFVMQFTIIFGGGIVMMLQSPMSVLVLLIVLKVIADLRGHYREHVPATTNQRL